MHARDLQAQSVEVGIQVFGEKNIKSREERLFRMAEEMFELLRAAGLTFNQAAGMLCYEYHQRKAGEVSQEVAGVQCTLYSFADERGIDTEAVTVAELARVLAKKDECRVKHAAKPASMRAA